MSHTTDVEASFTVTCDRCAYSVSGVSSWVPDRWQTFSLPGFGHEAQYLWNGELCEGCKLQLLGFLTELEEGLKYPPRSAEAQYMDYYADSERSELPETGIPIRAQLPDGSWGAVDAAHLKRDSLVRWLARGSTAINTVLALLGHERTS